MLSLLLSRWEQGRERGAYASLRSISISFSPQDCVGNDCKNIITPYPTQTRHQLPRPARGIEKEKPSPGNPSSVTALTT